MPRPRRLPPALLLPALLAATAVPTTADWLVTRSGDAIETSGEWEVRGALVVFETTGGELSSLQTREVDLDASRQHSVAPAGGEPAPPSAPVHRGPVRVITDADVGRARSSPTAVEQPAPESDATTQLEAEQPPVTEVEVVSWQDRVDVQANVLELTGSIANRGTSMVTDARVTVRLLGSGGELIESRQAALGKAVLAPGARVSFSAFFPGSPGYASVDFEVHARGFRVGPPAPPSADR